MIDAGYFLEKAEQCFRLSRAEGLNPHVVIELADMGQEFMAKAVYLDTIRDRESRSTYPQ